MLDPKKLASTLTVHEFHMAVIMYWTAKCKDLVQRRENVSREDLEYFAKQCVKMRDTRMANIASALIGWGDDEQAELETFCAIALEVMQSASPSRLRDAALKVNLRQLIGATNEQRKE
jgi:hypothetical protein